MNKLSMNEWTFSGTVFYLKEFDKDYGASLKLRGSSGNFFNSSIDEIGCLVTIDAWEDAVRKGVALNKFVTLSGHMESFTHGTSKSAKTMFIADYILEVA